MQLIENNINSFHDAHPTHVLALVDVAFSPEEVMVSLWIRELHYVNNSSAKDRMI